MAPHSSSLPLAPVFPPLFFGGGGSGVSSPNRGSRLLSGSRCQSLDCRTMLLSSADPAPGAVLMPLRAARLPGKQPEVAGHGAPPAHSRPLSPLRLPCPSPRLCSPAGSRETNSCERNLPTMVPLTNFQQIAPSHGQPLSCPLWYIPSRPVGLRGSGLAMSSVVLSLSLLYGSAV